jgi:hypothetical protein
MARSNGLGTTSKELRGKGMEQGVREQGAAAFQRSSFPAFQPDTDFEFVNR